MASRQIGHLFFEPKGYDFVNQATHEYKEEIKVGYNLRRKIILLTIWALSPLLLFVDPTLLAHRRAARTLSEFVRHVGYLWLALGHRRFAVPDCALFKIRDVQTGLVWATKILTDPFHDIKLYYRAPSHLLRGELIEGIRSSCRHASACASGSARARKLRPIAGQHLAQDLPLDRLVGAGGTGPPPAVPLHRPAPRQGTDPSPRKVRIAVVQAEDQPACADPAQYQSFGAQIILQHPIVAGRPRVAHRPDRREVRHPDRKVFVGQPAGSLPSVRLFHSSSRPS